MEKTDNLKMKKTDSSKNVNDRQLRWPLKWL